MKQQTENQKTKRVLIRLLIIILAVSPLFVATSYAWFYISRTPKVTDLYIYIDCNDGLLLSWEENGDDWGETLSFSDMYTEEAILRPVTYSAEEDMFYTALYGADGRVSGLDIPLPDERYANRDTREGYFVKAEFYAYSDSDVAVTLSPAALHSDGVSGLGTFVTGALGWDAETQTHYDDSNGVLCSIRIGFRITKLTSVDGEPEESEFFILEPSCDAHVEGGTEYIPTASTDGTDSLIDSEHLILQTANTFTETDPPLIDSVEYTYGTFSEDVELFSLRSGEKAKIEMYVWLEGNDVDCTNRIGQTAKVFANIQFTSSTGGHPGIEDFED